MKHEKGESIRPVTSIRSTDRACATDRWMEREGGERRVGVEAEDKWSLDG